VPEWGVAEVVTERDRFGQVLVQAERARDRARDLLYLERVRHPHGEVVADRGAPARFAEDLREDLGLVLQPTERRAVDDAVAVALEARAQLIARFLALATLALSREGRMRSEDLSLDALCFLADRVPQRRPPADFGLARKRNGARRHKRPHG